MKTRTRIIVAALMATAVGVAAVPSFADESGAPDQLAFYGPGRDRDGDGPGWRDGHGPRGPRDGGMHARFAYGPGMGMGGPGMGPGGPGMGPGFGDGPRGGGMTLLVERFDVNKDGTITKDEIASVNTDRVKSYDKDGDGALSLEEFTALWVETNKERIVRDFQARDPDGDAKVTLDEYAAPFAKMLSMLDQNDDGSIDASELRGPRGDRGPGFGKRGPGGPGAQNPPAMQAPPPAPGGAPDAPAGNN